MSLVSFAMEFSLRLWISMLMSLLDILLSPILATYRNVWRLMYSFSWFRYISYNLLHLIESCVFFFLFFRIRLLFSKVILLLFIGFYSGSTPHFCVNLIMFLYIVSLIFWRIFFDDNDYNDSSLHFFPFASILIYFYSEVSKSLQSHLRR